MTSSVGILGVIVALVLLIVLVKIVKNIKTIVIIGFVVLAAWLYLQPRTAESPVPTDPLQKEQSIVGKIKNIFQSGSMQWSELRSNLEKASLAIKNVQDSDFISEATKVLEFQKQLLGSGPDMPESTLPTTTEYEKLSKNEQELVQTSFLDQLKSLTPRVQQKSVVNDPLPVNIQVVKQGLLTDNYALETAQGLVTIYRQDSGLLYLYIQELEIPNGPDLELYLAEVDPETELPTEDFYYIADLKAIAGNQLYVLPESVPVEVLNTFFIYTPLTATVYAAAPLR